MSELAGQVALVTGAGRGIGRAIALAFAQGGAKVAVLGRNQTSLEQVRDEITANGGQALALPCDVSDAAAVRAAFGSVRTALGLVDILVNNAGIAASRKITAIDNETWAQIMQVNVTGPFYCCREAVPDMLQRGGGRIINIASMAALVGVPYSSAYSASKHALLGLTRSLALELGRNQITVNAICPGWVETDMLAEAVQSIIAKTGRSSADVRASLLASSNQRRMLTPEEIATEALRLAGPNGAGVTGTAVEMV